MRERPASRFETSPTRLLEVSIFIEWLRSRPASLVIAAALAQAFVWILVPAILYRAPPGDLPFVLAIGHEFPLGSYLGPPLAFWLAEMAYRIGGLFAVYALAQACVVTTYWAIFALGRLIVGAQQAAAAVLLMIGISVFTFPTPDFGPPVLTMALWAVILLHYWQAVGQGRRQCWVALAVESGLLLLTSYAGLVLIGILLLFTIANRHARAALASKEPFLAAVIAIVIMMPHLLWLAHADADTWALAQSLVPASISRLGSDWFRIVALILASHAGAAILILIATGWLEPAEAGPMLIRGTPSALARQFVYVIAIDAPCAATLMALFGAGGGGLTRLAPFLVLSTLAMVMLAGDVIRLRRQRLAILAWFGLLLGPAVLAVLALVTLPWFAVDLSVNQPAQAMAQFFAETFQRRVGAPLPIVAGEPRTAALVALGPSRPALFLQGAPEHSPWVTIDDVRARGAIVVWPTTDTSGTPPPEIKDAFPDLMPDLPQDFARPVRGRLPLLRIGWGIIRPQPPDR